MRVATRAAHSVAAHAQLLARSAVTALTRHRVDASLNAVLAATTAREKPTGRMRISGGARAADSPSRVAVETRALAMTRRAHAGVGTGFLRVSRAKSRSMKIRGVRVAERELPRQGGDGRAVARRAVSLTVAARAEVARTRGPNAVLADPIAVVHDVALGPNVLVFEIDVTAIAVADGPLVLVLVAAETRRHRRPERHWIRFGDLNVAAHAIPSNGFRVRPMLEAKVLSCELRTVTSGRFSVAAPAISCVVRFLVATDAIGRSRQVQRIVVARARHAGVARDAAHAFQDMGSVLERMRGSYGTETEHTGACDREDRSEAQERNP